MTSDKPFVCFRAGASTKKILLVDLAQLLFPKAVLVHDILWIDHNRHTAGEIFDAFAGRTAFDRTVVAMRFCICLLDQWQPSLIRLAVGEVQSFAASLQRIFQLVLVMKNACAFFLVAVPVSENAEIVVIADSQVEFVVNDFVYPLAICSC